MLQEKNKPNSATEIASQFFDQNEQNPEKYNCKLCEKSVSGKKRSNLTQHLRTVHNEKFEATLKKIVDPKALARKKMTLIQHFTEIVTINGRSFSHLIDSGFLKIVQKDLDDLKGTEFDINMSNHHQVKEYIENTATKIKSHIQKETLGRLVSLMMDGGTRNDQSFLSVDIRFVSNGKIIERCIGMKQLEEKHTAKYLAEVALKCVNACGIQNSQISTVTTDNARNITRSIEYFNPYDTSNDDANDDVEKDDAANDDQLNSLQIQYESIHLDESEFEAVVQQLREEEALEDALDDNFVYEQLFQDAVGHIPNHLNITQGIRCAAHTEQLVVRDAIGKSNVLSIIIVCKKVAKLIRTPKYTRDICKAKLKLIKPRLNCKTRWDSDYLMVKVFHSLRLAKRRIINNIISVFSRWKMLGNANLGSSYWHLKNKFSA